MSEYCSLITYVVDFVDILLNLKSDIYQIDSLAKYTRYLDSMGAFFIALETSKPARRAVGISKYTSPSETYVIFYDTSRTVGGWQAKRNSLEISSRRRLSRYRRWSPSAIHFRYTLKHFCRTIQYFLSPLPHGITFNAESVCAPILCQIIINSALYVKWNF